MTKEIENKFKLNLQLHAEPGEPPPPPPNPPPVEPPKEPPVEPPKDDSFTRKDVNAMIAAAVKKAQEEAKTQIEEEKRLSKLSAEEKAKEEKKALEDKLAEYVSKEAYNNALADTKTELEERKLPLGFAEFLVDSDSAKALEKIKTFEKSFKDEVQKAVEERLKNPNPPNNLRHDDKNEKPSLPPLRRY
ncbi:MAG: DUF4355 domain-containing protein [Firmicutes bacterium]|nr:DUF4355 domain-containing protein [Bacillota bacterium]